MKYLSLLFLMYFINALQAVAQKSGFTPGYYVNVSNDTIYGSLQINSETAGFKFRNGNDTTTILVPYVHVKAFHSGKKKFLVWNGPRNMSHLDADYQPRFLDSIATGPIPVKYIAGGNLISLYHYKDATDHFFAEMNGSLSELYQQYRFATFAEKQKTLYNPPTFIITPHYRNVLLTLLEGKIDRNKRLDISNTVFDKQSLINLVRTINRR